MVSGINSSDLILFFGLIFCNTSIYPKVPDCIGFSSSNEVLCCYSDCCVKANTTPHGIGCNQSSPFLIQFLCFCASCGVKKKMQTCCKGQHQVFCIVHAHALPPDHDVPATCAFLSCVVYPVVGICKRLSECSGGGP